MRIIRIIIVVVLVIMFLPFSLARTLMILASDPKTRDEMLNDNEELWNIQCRWIKTGSFEE